MATLLQQKNNCMKSLVNGTVSGGGTQQQQQQQQQQTNLVPNNGSNNQSSGQTQLLHNPQTTLSQAGTTGTRMLLPHEMVHSIQSSSSIIANMTNTVQGISGSQGTQNVGAFIGQQLPHHNLHHINNHNQQILTTSNNNSNNIIINIQNNISGTTSSTVNNSQLNNNNQHQQFPRYFSQFSNNSNSINSDNISTTNSHMLLTNSLTSSSLASTAGTVNNTNYIKHLNQHSHQQILLQQSHNFAQGSNLNNNIVKQIKTESPQSIDKQNGSEILTTDSSNVVPNDVKSPLTTTNKDAVDEGEEAESEPEIDIVINNVVCSFSVRCHLNLRDIALNGFNVEFRRENGMVTMKLRRPYTTASIWSSGRITCTGATSEDQAKIAARRYARCLQKLGFNVRFNNFRVVNVLGTCSMPWAIKIVNFSEKFKKEASYEPELHPGVTYKLKYPKATLKIFSTGSITVTAASVAHVQNAIEHIYPLVYEFRKKRSPQDLELLRCKQEAALAKQAALVEEAYLHSPRAKKFKQQQEEEQKQQLEQEQQSQKLAAHDDYGVTTIDDINMKEDDEDEIYEHEVEELLEDDDI